MKSVCNRQSYRKNKSRPSLLGTHCIHKIMYCTPQTNLQHDGYRMTCTVMCIFCTIVTYLDPNHMLLMRYIGTSQYIMQWTRPFICRSDTATSLWSRTHAAVSIALTLLVPLSGLILISISPAVDFVVLYRRDNIFLINSWFTPSISSLDTNYQYIRSSLFSPENNRNHF